MRKEDKGMYIYFGLIILYIFSGYLQGLLGLTFGMLTKIFLVGGFLVYYRSWFPMKLRFDPLAIVTGLGIALLWFFLDPFYPHLLLVTEVLSYSLFDFSLKLFMGVVLASIVEEFFTRYFLHRALESGSWLKVPLGTYSLSAFLVTTLFFAFSHSRWLPGLITGAILNILWYKKKNMNSIVVAHAIANLFLGLMIFYTGNYSFWS